MRQKHMVIEEVLRQLYEHTNRNHDAHYEEGLGVLVVPEGYKLHPRNVIMAIHEAQLMMMTMTGVNINVG
jgi:hypothetical protein